MNPAQWFMIVQTISCLGGCAGFFMTGQPWMAGVWGFYSAANVCWFMMAANALH